MERARRFIHITSNRVSDTTVYLTHVENTSGHWYVHENYQLASTVRKPKHPTIEMLPAAIIVQHTFPRQIGECDKVCIDSGHYWDCTNKFVTSGPRLQKYFEEKYFAPTVHCDCHRSNHHQHPHNHNIRETLCEVCFYTAQTWTGVPTPRQRTRDHRLGDNGAGGYVSVQQGVGSWGSCCDNIN